MILRHDAIIERMKKGDIIIQPFNKEQLNPNSYDVRLGDNIIVEGNKMQIPDRGYRLFKGEFILAETLERTETYNLVPMVEGKSSIGRQGLFIHVTAGFGDVGFKGKWTLELFACQDILIKPGMRIAQLFWYTCEGTGPEYNGKYQNATGVEGAKL